MVDKLKIEMVNIEDLAEYENNAKLHPDYQIEQIANSIKKFGFNDPIAIDSENVIIEGHGRLKAAKILGLKKVPVIKLSHLTEAEKKAYIVAHNKLTTATGYNDIKLSEDLRSIVETEPDIDLESMGIDISFLIKIEKSVDISEFMDSTKERKEDQEKAKKAESFKICPHCGKKIT
jgi:hypothetical protein